MRLSEKIVSDRQYAAGPSAEQFATVDRQKTPGVAASQELTRMPELHRPTRHLGNPEAGTGLHT
jgi:hypothetical protein